MIIYFPGECNKGLLITFSKITANVLGKISLERVILIWDYAQSLGYFLFGGLVGVAAAGGLGSQAMSKTVLLH